MQSNRNKGLLDEILTGEELESFRRRSLEGGLAALRQRQRRRRALGLAGPILALGVLLLLLTKPVTQPEVVNRVPAATPAMAKTPSPKTREIGDEDLLAMFPGKTIALIGRPGQQRFLVLE